MPQVQKTNKVTATTIKEAKQFRDRLRDRYAPSDYVRVINIDTESFSWQYFPSTGEVTEFTDNGAVRVVTGRQSFTRQYEQSIPGNEQIWELEPGASEVLLGDNADLFIEGLFKHMVAKKTVHKFLGPKYDPKVRRDYANKPEVKFNWTDGLLQEQMIDQILLGKETPNFDKAFNEPARSTTSKEE